ncbi:hypothetical protein D3C87_1770970 [compost metagenome]
MQSHRILIAQLNEQFKGTPARIQVVLRQALKACRMGEGFLLQMTEVGRSESQTYLVRCVREKHKASF